MEFTKWFSLSFHRYSQFPTNPGGLNSPFQQNPQSQRVQDFELDRWASNKSTPAVHDAGFSVSSTLRNDIVYRKEKLLVGSFNAHQLDIAKIKNPFYADRLSRIISEFACVAIQSVDTSHPQLLPELMNAINSQGRHYEFITDSVSAKEANAGLVIFFDTDQLEVDRHQTYSLRDNSGALSVAPLVAWFRSRQTLPKKRSRSLSSIVNFDHMKAQSSLFTCLTLSKAFLLMAETKMI